MTNLFASVPDVKAWLAVSLVILLGLIQAQVILAAGTAAREIQQPEDQPIALSSTEASCVTVGDSPPGGSRVTVHLDWEGRVEQAFLFLSASGSSGGHSLYVNGQRVGAAPARPGEWPCRPGSEEDFLRGEPIPVPAGALVKGENTILLTNDADPGDRWTASLVFLEIHGFLRPGAPAAPESPQISPQALITASSTIPSTYDPPYTHKIWYNLQPNGYSGVFGSPNSGSPTPLLVAIHGYGGSGQSTLNLAAAGADSRGWFVVAPDMHGNYLKSSGRQAFAWVGAQHDIIDAINFMRSQVNIDPDRIYIAGGSMGGQTTEVMAAKYPDVFAAAGPWKGISDLSTWYYQASSKISIDNLRREADPGCNTSADTDKVSGCGTPPQQPFEYQRRSAVQMPQNIRPLALKLWHDVQDELVPVTHSVNLKAAIGGGGAGAAVLSRVNTLPEPGNLCDLAGEANKHCYNPPPLTNNFGLAAIPGDAAVGNLFDFLGGKSRSSQPPLSLAIRTDESKPYYWLNVTQSGNAHWSEVKAAYSPANWTVTAIITDSSSLTLGFNLGSVPMPGPVMPQAGMGLPQATYLVKGGGNNKLQSYSPGSYFNVTVAGSGQPTSLTISAISIQLSPQPAVIQSDGAAQTTLTATVKDRLNNPAPDGTTITFSTTLGSLQNGGVGQISGGQGQATLVLTSATVPGNARVTAAASQASASTTVFMTPDGRAPPVYLPLVIKA